MQLANIVYFSVAGCAVVLLVAAVVYFTVNAAIKQLTERAVAQFQARLAHETAQAIAGFKAEVCEQMAQQERKSESLARLYSGLIDLMRDGKDFINCIAKGEAFPIEKGLRTLAESSISFRELVGRESLHFSDDFKSTMEGFCSEQEKLIERFEGSWLRMRKSPQDCKQDRDGIRQGWAAFEDRVGVVMELTRNEFRGRGQTPENVMKKWLGEATFRMGP